MITPATPQTCARIKMDGPPSQLRRITTGWASFATRMPAWEEVFPPLRILLPKLLKERRTWTSGQQITLSLSRLDGFGVNMGRKFVARLTSTCVTGAIRQTSSFGCLILAGNLCSPTKRIFASRGRGKRLLAKRRRRDGTPSKSVPSQHRQQTFSLATL